MLAVMRSRLGVAQFGSVLEWGSRGRKFESSHPDTPESFEIKGFRFFFTFPGLLRFFLADSGYICYTVRKELGI